MKSLSEYPTLKEYADNLGSRCYDWYRCYKCRGIITREQEVAWQKWAKGIVDDSKVTFCACGSMKVTTIRRPVRTEWLNYAVLRYAVKVILARGLGPWCDRHFRLALPLIEYAVSSRRGESNG